MKGAVIAIGLAALSALSLAAARQAAAAAATGDLREVRVENSSSVLIRPVWSDPQVRRSEEGDPIAQGTQDVRRFGKDRRISLEIEYWDSRDLSGGGGTNWAEAHDCNVQLAGRPDQVQVKVTGRFGHIRCDVQ